MIVIDIYGSPSSGKSTLAAYVFAKLKMMGIRCELVTEFAKDLVWDERPKALQNQAFVFGNQFYRLSRLEHEVDVAVVDSPLMLNILYNTCPKLGGSFTSMVVDVSKSYDTLSYWLPVVNKSLYEETGRIHTIDESEKLSNDMLHMLDFYGIKYKKLDHSEASMNGVVDDVVKKVNA